MRVDFIVCADYVEDKLETKHNVTCQEAREVLLNSPRIRFAEKGHTKGEDVYVAFGTTFSGSTWRYFLSTSPLAKRRSLLVRVI